MPTSGPIAVKRSNKAVSVMESVQYKCRAFSPLFAPKQNS